MEEKANRAAYWSGTIVFVHLNARTSLPAGSVWLVHNACGEPPSIGEKRRWEMGPGLGGVTVHRLITGELPPELSELAGHDGNLN